MCSLFVLICCLGLLHTTVAYSMIKHISPWEKKNTYQELEGAYAILTNGPEAPLPTSFTICSSTMALPGPGSQTFFTLLGKDGNVFITAHHYNDDEVGGRSTFYYVLGTEFLTPSSNVPMVFPYMWTRQCFAISSQRKLLRWVMNGIILEDKTVESISTIMKNQPTNLTGKYLIGATRYASGWQPPRHKTSNVNLFASLLSVEKMQDLTRPGGQCVAAGDYLDWQKAEWQLYNGAELETLDAEEMCAEESGINIYMAKFHTMESCMWHCQKMKGRAPGVTSVESWQALSSFVQREVFDEDIFSLVGLWMAVTDRQVEGVWRDYYDDTVLDFTPPFTGTGPNGGSRENCAFEINPQNWIDWLCTAAGTGGVGCLCSKTRRPFLRLRGVCPGSALDDFYLATNRKFESNKFVYVSNKDTDITYTDGRWELSKTIHDVTATSDSSLHSYVLGSHTWKIEKDNKVCNNGEPYTAQLKLTGCAEGEFTCKDGQCITMEQRCNQLLNCRDQSDEDDCQLLVFPSSYKQNVPPVYFSGGSNFRPANVNISIILLKIVSLEEVSHTIDFQFSIVLEWKENRVDFQNLKQETSLNALTIEEIHSLWLPYIVYGNTNNKEAVELDMGVKTTITVTREGAFVRSGPEEVDETELFRGDENKLTMNQTYTKNFQCEYQLERYPFDTQKCSIEMNVQVLDLKTVDLIPDEIIMKEKTELTMYMINDWELVDMDEVGKERGVRMSIVLKRRIANELLTTYLPSILLILITYATTFFKPFYFEAALSVNLTTMLVMTTIFISVMDKLPSTAYIKMVDYWLIFGQLVPFTEVVLLTAMEYLRKGNNSGMQSINHHGTARTVVNSPSAEPKVMFMGAISATEAWADLEEDPRIVHMRYIGQLGLI